jgi:hypothetical protein
MLVAAAMLAPARRASAGNTEDARAYVEKATAEFALTKYAPAAEDFEKAFELKPDPALLYNAAQSHRLAGNKERALALYRNYLRLYAPREKRPEIEARISELERAIAHDKAIESKPPNGTEPFTAPPGAGSQPPASPPPVTSPLPTVAPPPTGAPALVAQPAPTVGQESVFKRPWFWIVVAGGVAAAVGVGIALGSGSKDPSPSIGRINGN